MDKIIKVKLLLLTQYFSYLRKIQRGYPVNGYAFIKESMAKVEWVSTGAIQQWQKDAILDSILNRLILTEPFTIQASIVNPGDITTINWNDDGQWSDDNTWHDE